MPWGLAWVSRWWRRRAVPLAVRLGVVVVGPVADVADLSVAPPLVVAAAVVVGTWFGCCGSGGCTGGEESLLREG